MEAKAGSFLGDGIPKLSAAGQTRTARIDRWDGSSVAIRSDNDGTLDDTMSYRAIGTNPCVRITCRRTGPPPRTFTANLKVGLARCTTLAPSGRETSKSAPSPNAPRRRGKKSSYQLTHYFRSLSGLDPAKADVVRISLIAK